MREFRGLGRHFGPDPPPPVSLRDVELRRVGALFHPYWRLLAVILLLLLVGAVIQLGPPLIMREIIDKALPSGDRRRLLELIGLMVALPIAGGLLGVLENHLNVRVGQGVMRDLRQGLYRNLQRQSMAFFTRTRAGEVIQRLTADVQAVREVVTRSAVMAVTQLVTVLTTVAILLALDWRLASLSLLALPLFVLPVRTVSRIRRRLRGESQRAQGDLSAHLGEVFGTSGAMLVRIFNRERQQEQRFTGLNEKLMDLELRTNLVGRWFGMLVGLLAPMGMAMIFLYGGFGVLEGRMTVGDIVAFIVYLGRLYGPVAGLLNLQVEVATAMAVFVRIFEYQDLEPDVQDAPDAYPLPPLRGQISFRQVSFAYRWPQYALADLTFQVEPGQLIALVGPSGAGKTTLIGLVARLYDPTAGTVAVDGHDIRRVTLSSLREQIAVVTQDPFLFHDTIRENLLFAREHATQAELEDACRAAYLQDFIISLPDGYETVVGERGHRLSGGERQRLAIARAVLKDPRILILDEATSHLDSRSEAGVQAALERLMPGRTTLVIAHRLSTILKADKILVLDEGRVVEEGSHRELLAHKGLYAHLYRTQFARAAQRGVVDEAT